LIESDAFWSLFIGGYGSGKTFGGAAAFFCLCAQNPGSTGFIAAPSYNLLMRVTLPAFFEIADKYIKKGSVNKQLRRCEICNGAEVFWGSADRPQSLEGTNCSQVWLDEAQDASHAAFKILGSRLRVKANKVQGLCTATPKSGTWLRREFDSGKKGRELIRVSTRENIFNREGFVEDQLEAFSEAEAKAYIDGEWYTRDGRIYEDFSRDLHIIPYKPNPNWPVICGVDFGLHWPAVVYAQVTQGTTYYGDRIIPDGSVIVFDEDNPNNITTDGLGRRIATRFTDANGNRKLHIEWLGVDPAGSSGSKSAAEQGGLNDITALRQALRDNGLSPQIRYAHGPGSGRIRHVNVGIEQQRGLLLNANGITKLYFSSDLLTPKPGSDNSRGIITGMESYVWRRGTQSPLRGERADQVDHTLDALRYLLRHLKSIKPGVYRAA